MERITTNQEIMAWKGNIPVENLYTVGIAGEIFFRGLMNRKILGTKCKNCNLTYLPGSMFCPKCMEELKEWVEIQNKGVLYSFTIVEVDFEGEKLSQPKIIGFVKFDEAEGGLIHYIEGIEKEKLKIGLTLTAKFREKREGSILDIEYFKPVT